MSHWDFPKNQNRSGTPPYWQSIIYYVQCGSAKHLERSGAVELSFFNDRLAAVRFLTSAEEEYAAAFLKGYGVKPVAGRKIRVAPHITVVFRRTKTGFPLEWHDDRLEKENRSWIRKYA